MSIDLVVIGMILILVGIIFIVISILMYMGMGGEAGGVVLIGPIPIVFGTSRRIIKILLPIILIVILIYILLIIIPYIQIDRELIYVF